MSCSRGPTAPWGLGLAASRGCQLWALRGDYGHVKPTSHDFAEFVGAWRDKRRWADAHPDLATHYAARYRAFASAFEADLDECPTIAPPVPDCMAARMAEFGISRSDHWHREVYRFTLETDHRYRYLSGPFSGYLEIPPEMLAVRDRFSPAIAKPLAEARNAITVMVLELLVALHPGAAQRVVTQDELRVRGFDPAVPGPDPDDYW